MPGRGTTGAIFVTRQLCEKFMAKNRKLHWIFIDLEKLLTEGRETLLKHSIIEDYY